MAEPNVPSHSIKSPDECSGGLEALGTYRGVLDFLAMSGRSRPPRPSAPAELPFLQNVPGLKNLFLSMSGVAPAVPDTSEEEWNPISQRPHSAIPPVILDGLGSEIIALKTAVDEFTILSHEMMHVALWEPFFAGLWRPLNRQAFRQFSLMAEGFCYFFSDIVVSGAIRVRLPDGEFALERQTPSNVRFHPVRAFQSLGIVDPHEILDIYLEGFRGQPSRLWQPRGKSHFAASLAGQAYDFYAGSRRLLDEMHGALKAFGGLSEFYKRFCQVPGLPTFVAESESRLLAASQDPKGYFEHFFTHALPHLATMTEAHIEGLRCRRMLQMRAYYALQVRWLLRERRVVARGLTAAINQQLQRDVEAYLGGLEELLRCLARDGEGAVWPRLTQMDTRYDHEVRTRLEHHQAWVGQRWLIAPRRAGGSIDVQGTFPVGERAAKKKLSLIVAFLVQELSARLGDCKTVAGKAIILDQIKQLADLGAAGSRGSTAQTAYAVRRLKKTLSEPFALGIWSVPLASFDPANNRYRELVFSYQ